jgi:gamma-glutamyl:cysteine ligase YbdK (ATP-grasp superfamily)
MGEQVDPFDVRRADRRLYREKVRRCLNVFARMLRESAFATSRPKAGLELELNLVDRDVDPTMNNAEVLAAINEPAWQTELGRFNIEVNLPPRHLDESGLTAFEEDLVARLTRAEAAAAALDTRLAMIGILPTLGEKHLGAESLSADSRYALLDEQILAARGEDLHIAIVGEERLSADADTIAPEAACTSAQFHVQVTPESFAHYWNAAQAVAGVQLAVGANSPFLFGRRLWAETRIPLFEQATDLRPEELKSQGVRPRVWFGERWITSVFDLFEENTRYFHALLPVCTDEDPLAVLEAGGVPRLGELTLHNGTIYRWNRPVYAVVDGVPHLRVENRVAPAGPTVVDTVANLAFFLGLVRGLTDAEQPVWTRMPYGAARENFRSGARYGIGATMFWPDTDDIPATELVLRHLLPVAACGLDAFGADPAERDRLLGIVEARCTVRRNGASWQTSTLTRLEERGLDRADALRALTRTYLEHMQTGEPVHTWPLG